MRIIDLNEEQVEDIETRLSAFDENYINYKMDGCIQTPKSEKPENRCGSWLFNGSAP